MPYDFTLDDVEFLRSPDGVTALDDAAALDLSTSTIIADIARLRSRYAPWDAALVDTVRCRRRAVGKIRDAQRWLFTDTALQQATATAVADNRADRIARRWPGASVHDVTCSIGGELAALARHPDLDAVSGSDLDPVRVAMARHNLDVSDLTAALTVADALDPGTAGGSAAVGAARADVVIADPGRRSGSGRVFRIDHLTPPLPDLFEAYRGRPMVVKCAPGIDYDALRESHGFTGEAQIVSLDAGVREACLWTGTDDDIERRATVLRSTDDGVVGYEVTDTEPDDVDPGDPATWIIDPDGAVVRAGLVRQYAYRHGLRQLDPQIAYLTGDAIPPGERGFRILQQVGVSEKSLRRLMAEHDCGTLEILVRGLDVDPDALRRRLRLRGGRSLALVLTRIGRRGVGFLCEAGVRG
ncbi:THUMP-like domain-containing protein [Gordonia soli]|uniref:THUMP-like domain-containing protein n=1 Tax=Gordonia soli NBRC 108243 TaxID=1223545 RepID=M0QDJ8_9ACTN|nr:hypothetical protein [Gordonia soli]GAC66381.1 hypothetical protein GS4_02_00920 [Gordonia soli NBRC 108243]